MNTVSDASLSYLPWVRQGAATAITAPEQPMTELLPAGVTVSPTLLLNGTAVAGVQVRLRGPADVQGIDPQQVVRLEPCAGSHDFEPNHFPAIEFDRPDFPWLFTPAAASPEGKLRPWLCLVVVRKQPGVTVSSPPSAPLPMLQIAAPALPAVELPDLRESYAWAHAQAAGLDSTPQGVRDALDGGPEQSLSRLLCPRVLAPDTGYLACVVPTFDVGRRAGLGLPVADSELSATAALQPAWTTPPAADAAVQLPIYFQWEFRTGRDGGFEDLVRRLQARVVDGLGQRPVDVSRPGFEAAEAGTVLLEGALLPLPGDRLPDPVPSGFRPQLAAIVGEPAAPPAGDAAADPVLAPPLYGRWHAGQASVEATGNSWLEQLNLDLRWRMVAALGTQVVRKHQEALMASAWNQAGDLLAANQRMRQMQLSLAVGEVLHARHFSRMGEDRLLRVAAPAFGRLYPRRAPGLAAPTQAAPSLLAEQAGSMLPVAANRSAMRSIGRLRGPLTRRVARQDAPPRSGDRTWVAVLNQMGVMPVVMPPPPACDFAVLPPLPLQHLDTDSWFGAFFVAAEDAPVTAPGVPVWVAGRTEAPGFFRAAARRHRDRFFVPHDVPVHSHHLVFQDFRALVLDQTLPSVTLPRLAAAVLGLGEQVLSATAPGVAATGLETVMAAPVFTQPMAEALCELSPDLLLPGLERVAPDSVLGLRTNHSFVDAFMVGLNHEMGRELLWRGFPTDQRGTCFAHFWGLGVPNAAPPDIEAIHTWDKRALGARAPQPGREQFVMLMRSALLQRYPNAVIYLAPALPGSGEPVLDPDTSHDLPPLFSGAMPPDVSFFGFPISSDAACGTDGGRGWFVVIQEHPTEPRFGLALDLNLGEASHLPVGTAPPPGVVPALPGWGVNSALMAAITQHQPVRVVIHASRLMVQPAVTPSPDNAS